MYIFTSFYSLFTKSYTNEKTNETFTSVNLSCESNAISLPSKEGIAEFLNLVQSRDTFSIGISMDGGDSVNLSGREDSKVEQFLCELDGKIRVKDHDSVFSIYLSITKTKENDCLSIYLFNNFVNFLSNLKAEELFKAFNDFIVDEHSMGFEILDQTEISFYTSTFSFYSKERLHLKSDFNQRSAKINKLKESCHFENASLYNLLPEDFYFLKRSDSPELNAIFDKLTILFSIIYLFDITSIKANILTFKLYAYRVIYGEIDFNSASVSAMDEYYRLYEWVYSQGNLSDKIGLARNILCLHFQNNKPLELVGSPLNSVKSSYEIYLKDNVKQYIEVKNKVSEFLYNISQRANSVVDSFTDSFKKGLMAVLTFYSSVIVVKAISSSKINTIFTNEVSYISYIFIAVSFAYLGLSVWEINRNKHRFTRSYNSLKERYTDLLIAMDIERIFQNDEEYKQELRYIEQKRNFYACLWGLSLVALLFITIILNRDYQKYIMQANNSSISVNPSIVKEKQDYLEIKTPTKRTTDNTNSNKQQSQGNNVRH
jgi:hypothetical protein